MPAGDSREALFKSYPVLFDWVRDNGYRMYMETSYYRLLKIKEKYNV